MSKNPPAEGKQSKDLLGSPATVEQLPDGGMRIGIGDVQSPQNSVSVHLYRLITNHPGPDTNTIVLAQVVPTRVLHAVFCLQIAKDALHTLVESFGPSFAEKVKMGFPSDPYLFRLTEGELKTICEIEPDRVVSLKVAGAKAAVSFGGGQVDWFDITPMSLHLMISGQIKRPQATGLITTAMPVGCLLGLVLDIQKADSGEV